MNRWQWVCKREHCEDAKRVWCYWIVVNMLLWGGGEKSMDAAQDSEERNKKKNIFYLHW